MPEISAHFWYLRKRRNTCVLELEDEDEEEDLREPKEEERVAEGKADGDAVKSFLTKPILVLWLAGVRALACIMLATKAISDS